MNSGDVWVKLSTVFLSSPILTLLSKVFSCFQHSSGMPQVVKMKPSLISSLLSTISNHFKPHRAEALQRIRINAFSLVLVVVFSNLLPLPTIQRSLRLVISDSKSERWSSDWLYRWFCILGERSSLSSITSVPKALWSEVTLAVVFAFNLLQGVYAVQYPRTVLATPEKQKSLFQNTTHPKRSFRVLSPNVCFFQPIYLSLTYHRNL